ncbi:MAG: APC family permease [Candidatus Odinarchaeia archaeon]
MEGEEVTEDESKEELTTVKKKSLGLWQCVVLGMAFMAPALSLLATFGLVLTEGYTWVGVPLAYLIAGIAAILTAVSFAELTKKYPTSGSVWSFAKGSIGPRFGQFTVWMYLLELIVVPAAALIPVGFIAQQWFGISPWVIVLVFLVGISAIAILGIEMSIKVMLGLLVIQIGVLMAFAFSSIAWSIGNDSFFPMATLAISPAGSLFGFAGIMVGATIAIYSYIGYESPATVGDETRDPSRTLPKAIIICALVMTALYTFLAWAFVLAIPTKGLFALLFYINPVPAMADVIWGPGLGGILSFAGIITGIIAALAAVTAASRVLQTLSEDNIAPSVFKKLDRRFATPIIAIAVICIITTVLTQFVAWEIIAFTIATGALPTFILTNFLAFWHYKKSKITVKHVFLHVLIPWIGIALSAYFIVVGLPIQFKWILLMWIPVGAALTFANSAIKPSVFSEKTSTSRRNAAIGFAISIILLVIVVLGFTVWLTYYSGGIQWWRIVPPYAIDNFVATGVSIALIVGFAAVLIYSLKRSVGEEKQV